MGRIIRVLIYTVVIMILYLILITYVNSCQEKSDSKEELNRFGSKNDTLVSTEPLPVDSAFEADINYDALDNEVAAIEENLNTASETEVSGNRTGELNTNESPAHDPNDNHVDNGGKYLVMAGSYLIRENAESMMKNLKKMGFTHTEVVIFDNSQYHTVLAGRYNDENSARQLVVQLKQKGVESYVKAR
jgi:cell division septation protein DedD